MEILGRFKDSGKVVLTATMSELQHVSSFPLFEQHIVPGEIVSVLATHPIVPTPKTGTDRLLELHRFLCGLKSAARDNTLSAHAVVTDIIAWVKTEIERSDKEG